MCIICVSAKGVRQPSLTELKNMWERNPDGAGYMVARNGKVEIHKGFMFFDDLLRSLKSEKFTKDDPVIYHFRISTQAGICPEMTHPFPLTRNYNGLCALDVTAKIGVAHNGIIQLTSNGDKNYSDTALFIGNYMTKLVKTKSDVHDKTTLQMIEKLIGSKMAIMDGDGAIETIGTFCEDEGMLFSNASYRKITQQDVTRFWYYPKPHAKKPVKSQKAV